MDAKTLKGNLTVDDITRLMQSLNANPVLHQDTLMCSTICHGGHKHKLYYYSETHSFVCYTGSCGTMDVFTVVQKANHTSFFEAFKFIQNFFGITTKYHEVHLVENPVAQLKKKLHQNTIPQLKTLNPNIINSYYQFADPSWLAEGITSQTMQRYNIRYSIMDHSIIIPHFDVNNNLVGVRERNLSKDAIDAGRKYIPVRWHHQLLNYPTGNNLYGLNQNINQIKQSGQIILFEAEKSVLKLDSSVGNLNNSVALDGSNLTTTQIEMLKQLNVSEVVVALDKEFQHPFSREERIYAEKIQSQFYRLKPRFNVSIVWDVDDSLNYKDSPIDQGIETFKHLMSKRIYLN